MTDQLYIDDECDQCMYYVKSVSNSDSWKCSICQLIEPKLFINDKEGYYLWNRYVLKCNHQVHIRCYRVWCKENNCVGCPECGKKEKKEENLFCMFCKNFGHPRHYCPVVEDIRIKEYLISIAGSYCPK
jgi:hypothetical protein